MTVDQERLLGGRGKRSVREATGGIRAMSASFLYCYEVARERAPALEGEMQLVVTVERTGKLSDARVVGDTTADASFTACVARRVGSNARSWRLQRRRGSRKESW